LLSEACGFLPDSLGEFLNVPESKRSNPGVLAEFDVEGFQVADEPSIRQKNRYPAVKVKNNLVVTERFTGINLALRV
jgi:hypothetical protein